MHRDLFSETEGLLVSQHEVITVVSPLQVEQRLGWVCCTPKLLKCYPFLKGMRDGAGNS